jgi:hypothetical protein
MQKLKTKAAKHQRLYYGGEIELSNRIPGRRLPCLNGLTKQGSWEFHLSRQCTARHQVAAKAMGGKMGEGVAVRTSTPSSGRFCARPLAGGSALAASRKYDFRPAADSYRFANGRRRRRAGVPSAPSSSGPTTSTRSCPRWPREATSSGTQHATSAGSTASCSRRQASSLSNSLRGATSRGVESAIVAQRRPTAPASRGNALLTRETGPARVAESACRKRCLFQFQLH